MTPDQGGERSRECEICHHIQSADNFGNPHAPEICESCYRLIGVDIWAAGDE